MKKSQVINDRRSLGARLLIPIFIIIAIISASIMFLVHIITEHITDDYYRFIVSSSGNEVSRLLDSAAAELTAAKLLDVKPVVEAKQKTLAEAINNSWQRNGSGGIIVSDNDTVILTTFPAKETEAIVSVKNNRGYYSVDSAAGHLHCYSQSFPLWGWNVVTASPHKASIMGRKEVTFLVPIVALGSLIMAGGLFLVLRRNLQQPVAAMVSAVKAGHQVEPTGVTELDDIGGAVNEAVSSLREQTSELENELAERSRAEKEILAKNEYIRLLLESTAEGIFGIDLNGICTFCNQSCLRILKYEKEDDLIGKNIHGLIHYAYPGGKAYPESDCRIYMAFSEERRIHVPNEVFFRPDGSSVPIEYWAHPLYRDGEITGAVVTFIDISERRFLEQQLLQSQKMEAIGQLAGGIAHDFNNILSAIIGYGSIILDDMNRDNPFYKYVDQIILASGKASELTKSLLAFSRKQVIDPKPVDLNGIVKNIEKILRRLVRENIEMRTILLGRDLIVMADSSQVDQVLMNLVTNARDAMPQGGMLTIETSLYYADEKYSEVHGFDRPGKYACLSVSDTGVGMDEKIRERIFDPFFTTKEMGQGTGLGLSIVFGIVKQHNGYINVYSEPGKGSSFRIYLPLITLAEKEQPPETPPSGGSETILIAEDDPAVRSVLRNILEKNGYKILEARDGAHAIEVFNSHADDIGLLLFDIMMPSMNGLEAYDRIINKAPGTRAIFMSGYTDDTVHRKGIMEKGLEFIEKPIIRNILLKKVRRVLDT